MKLLGKGYYYKVYDIGNGRVRKIEKDIFQKIFNASIIFTQSIPDSLTAYKMMFENLRIMPEVYKRISHIANPEIIGNPKFLDGINYEQDRVELLCDVLEHATEDEGKKIIDVFIQNIIMCWRNGFSDNVYNFTLNNGLDSRGDVVLIDFNEITFVKEEAAGRIKSKRWLRSYSYTQINSSLQKYYRDQMDALITLDSLNQNWKS